MGSDAGAGRRRLRQIAVISLTALPKTRQDMKTLRSDSRAAAAVIAQPKQQCELQKPRCATRVEI